MADPKPLFYTHFTFKRGGRRKLWVGVWLNRQEMWAAAARDGYPMKSGRAVTMIRPGAKEATIHLSLRCTGTEVITHESVHAAQWLLESAPKIRRFRNEKEDLAFWTGQIAKAIVGEFYRLGVYKGGH